MHQELSTAWKRDFPQFFYPDEFLDIADMFLSAKLLVREIQMALDNFHEIKREIHLYHNESVVRARVGAGVLADDAQVVHRGHEAASSAGKTGERLFAVMVILDRVLIEELNEVQSDMQRRMYQIFTRMCHLYIRWKRALRRKRALEKGIAEELIKGTYEARKSRVQQHADSSDSDSVFDFSKKMQRKSVHKKDTAAATTGRRVALP